MPGSPTTTGSSRCANGCARIRSTWRASGGAAKAGAAGCIGIAHAGYGVGAKAWTGSGEVAAMGAALGLDRLGVITSAIAAGLEHVISPRVLGGGKEVGRFRTVAVLEN